MYTPSYQLLDSYITDSSIVLPRFQRKKTWTNAQKFNLALSIYRGYPIGVVILYKEKQSSAQKYLLDGRQRRNAAAEIYLNPSELMKWAFKELKLTKKSGEDDKKEDVLRKFAIRIEDYLEQEPTLDEKDEDTDDQVLLSDFDESGEDNFEEVEDYIDVVDDKNIFDSEGFSKLRDMIVIAWTNRTKCNDGLCSPFDLSEYCTVTPPYYYQDSTKKIDCAELRKFLKRYKEDYPDDGYKDVNNFLKYINMYINPNQKKALIDEKLSGMWDDMLKVIELFGDLETRIKNTQLSTIDVFDVNMTDAQKIFNLINKGGTQLTAVEVLSARPGWNRVLENPSSDLLKVRKNLYEKLEINVGNEVVKWDVAASFIRRIKHINLVFPVSANDNVATITKQATQGFQLLSGVYKKSIAKAEYETLYKVSDIDWTDGIDELVDDFSKMLEIVSETTYFYYFQTWNTCLSKVLSEGCAIDFLLELYFDWKRKNKPKNRNDSACKAFKRNVFIVTDRLIYEYYSGYWKGAGDSRIGSNLKRIEKTDSNVFEPIDNSLWSKLITDAFDENKTRKRYGEYAPILYHYVCLKKIKAQNMEDAKTASVDHIIPQASWKSHPGTDAEKRVKMDNISNLALVDSKTNSVKNNKKLTECKGAEPGLIDTITVYEGIKVEDFDKYSNPSNWPSLQTERLSLFKATFVNEGEKKSDRTIYLEETY